MDNSQFHATDLQGYFDANQNNPMGVSQFLNMNGYTRDSAASKLGIDAGHIDSYFQQNGINPWGDVPNQVMNAPAPAPVAQQSQGGFGMVGQNMGMGPTGYAPQQQLQPGPANGGGNPYLGGQANAITNRVNDNLSRNLMPQISQGAMAAGGYGGSRQGVVEANAFKDANLGLGDSLANLYGTDWTNQQNRQLSRYGMDQGFYTAQRGQDQTDTALGANLMTQGQQGQWGPINGATGTYDRFTGLGTTTQSQNSGGGWTGAVGGALGAAQLGSNMGWWK